MHNPAPDDRMKRAVRPVAGVILFVVGTVQLFKAQSEADVFGLLFGFGMLIVAAGLVAPMIAGIVAAPAGRVFYPGERFSRPQPVYSIPRSRRAFGKYEEAILELRNIAKEYPEELEAWTEMIDIAVTDLRDGDRALALYHEGLAVLEDPERREALGRTFHAQMIWLKQRQAADAREQKPFRLELPPDEPS